MPRTEAQDRASKKIRDRLYKERKAAGTCTHCGKVPEAGYTHCRALLTSISASKARLRAGRLEAGACPTCGGKDKFMRFIRCLSCRDKDKERKRERKAAGLCSKCGKGRALKFATCIACRSGRKVRV